MQTLNVIDTAIKSGIFQTFTGLLEGSALESRLRSEEVFTLFLPVDISFAYLPPETFDHLLKAESHGTLSDVLGYHVVLGKVMSCELRGGCQRPTVCGTDLTVDDTDELRVDGARLLHVDILACNGVIHGIDRLLMPLNSVTATLH
jgi:uncharacterized surface protein with fasciclin (FAS1) repeats